MSPAREQASVVFYLTERKSFLENIVIATATNFSQRDHNLNPFYVIIIIICLFEENE